MVPDLASLLSQEYPVIAFPPVAGADHETVSWFATVLAAVGAAGVAGTVVAVTVVVADAAEVPAAFVAVTLTV